MYSGIQRIEEVISEIEDRITENIDLSALAARMRVSLYEFRRIFSFIVGCPLSEYIRKRRLSLAALELSADKKCSIQAISEKYGYSTESAFSKAFREQHGVPPTVCRDGGCRIELFTRPKLELSVKGGSSVPLTVIRESAFYVRGTTRISPHTDTCCCDEVWRKFYDEGEDKSIRGDRIYASYRDLGGEIACVIGEGCPVSGKEEDGVIPESSWACFSLRTVDDDEVNKKYGEILYEVLPSARLERDEQLPIIEIFPLDMSNDGFEWEIRIPIKSKGE